MTEHDLARTRERVVEDVFAELRRAETTHPSWPTDPFVGVAVITEELGETAQAIIDARYKGASRDRIYDEAVQVAAMALRFLLNMPVADRASGTDGA